MSRRTIRAALALLVLALPAAAQGAPGASIEGSWLLVEQSYGEGRSNLASAEEPIVLRFTRQGTAHAGALLGADPSRARAWPAWEAAGAMLPATLLDREEGPAGGWIRVRYAVEPSKGDPMVLQVTEEYALEPATGDLVGTVKVVFVVEEGTRGGYVLHRRFERIP